MEVGIRELKANLSQYLARVRAGEHLVVTDRGQAVARLEPLPSNEPPAALRGLVEAGRLIYRPCRGAAARPEPMRPGGKDSADYVREQRR